LANGKVLYHTAAVGIVLDPSTNTQRHFLGHNDDILSIALHPDGTKVATGQIGPKPKICIWDSTTMQELHMMTTPLQKGIKCLTFSEDGNLLAACAIDDEHCIAIWSMKAKPGQALPLIATGKGSRAWLYSLSFSPQANQLVSCGIKEVNFHTW
jgi:echinoderm microtubule-associated protein-like 6